MSASSSDPIGILKFPCPRCSSLTPIDLALADPRTVFACAAATCDFTKPLGATFPRFSVIVARNQHLDDTELRQRVVDALSAWFFEWSIPDGGPG